MALVASSICGTQRMILTCVADTPSAVAPPLSPPDHCAQGGMYFEIPIWRPSGRQLGPCPNVTDEPAFPAAWSVPVTGPPPPEAVAAPGPVATPVAPGPAAPPVVPLLPAPADAVP